MKTERRMVVTLALLGGLALGARAAEPGPGGTVGSQEALDVAEAAVTTAVEDRQPTDTVSTVPSGTERIYYWTRIVGAEDETEVVHVWFHEGEERARVTLRVGSADWRTWSSKALVPEWTGRWRVEVRDSRGEVLGSATFEVR